MGPQVHSLLPYLDASSGNLKICLVAQDLPTLEKVSFPFLVLSEADPFSLLIEARFVTDAGSELKKVFLLVQRDAYPVGHARLQRVTNRDIEHAWQKGHDLYLRGKIPPAPVALSCQFTESGTAAPLHPVFYCKRTAAYFHPPCPNCGSALRQCEDDARLQEAGLQPYTGSLKRYLFCPSCSASGPGGFYVKERGRTDPPTVSDREELIRAFGRCRERAEPATRFPCPGCPHHEECYEPGNRATARITALSFYPFHLLAFEAGSLCAADFLALLSGASLDEVAAFLQAEGEQGRLGLVRALGDRGVPGVPFLFAGGERWFLEVLYLKLSFLGEALRTLIAESDILRHPDMAFSTERLWVRMADQGGLLPFLWNFRVQLIDIGGGAPVPSLLPESPGSFGLHRLGLMWFEALLSNRRQANGRVHDALRWAAETCPLEDDRFADRIFRGRSHPAFLPENIFWDSQGKGVDAAWSPLWEKALRLGWSLLAASSRRGPEWSAETFLAGVESVRTEVREALFPSSLSAVRPGGMARREETSAPPQTPRPRRDEEEAIYGILQRIHATWKGAADTQRKEPTDELEKTLILSSPGAKQPPDPGRLGASGEAEEVFLETVILSSGEGPGRSTSPPVPAASSAPEQEAQEQETPVGADELDKTVILDAAKLRGKGRDGSKK